MRRHHGRDDAARRPATLLLPVLPYPDRFCPSTQAALVLAEAPAFCLRPTPPFLSSQRRMEAPRDVPAKRAAEREALANALWRATASEAERVVEAR